MTRQQAAEFLSGYNRSKKQKHYLENLLKEMQEEKGSELFCKRIRKEISEEWQRMQDIQVALNRLENEDGKAILYCRFIMGLGVQETAERVFMSSRHVQRITNKALDELASKI